MDYDWLNEDVVSITFDDEGLKDCGLIDVSPWDGVEDSTLELERYGGGVSKLIGVCAGKIRMDEVFYDSDNEDINAAKYLSTKFKEVDGKTLRYIAEEEGGKDRDPWPNLISHVYGSFEGKEFWKDVCEIALEIIQKRRGKIIEVSFPENVGDVEERDVKCWEMVKCLRGVELEILKDAEDCILRFKDGDLEGGLK